MTDNEMVENCPGHAACGDWQTGTQITHKVFSFWPFFVFNFNKLIDWCMQDGQVQPRERAGSEEGQNEKNLEEVKSPLTIRAEAEPPYCE